MTNRRAITPQAWAMVTVYVTFPGACLGFTSLVQHGDIVPSDTWGIGVGLATVVAAALSVPAAFVRQRGDHIGAVGLILFVPLLGLGGAAACFASAIAKHPAYEKVYLVIGLSCAASLLVLAILLAIIKALQGQ